jgi:hypothetical protein
MEISTMSAARPAVPPNPTPLASACHPPKQIDEASSLASATRRIDRFVEWLRWPLAISAAAFTPLLIWSLIRLSGSIISSPSLSLIPFALGGLGFIIAWRRWLGFSRLGSLLITLEHEMTHALFAFLTGHSILGFRATLGRGAEVRLSGRGNWMITAAPYFFPTAAILLFLMAYFFPFASLPWQSLMLGVAMAYHVISTRREIYRDRVDLRLLGPLFCWMFLPAANLAVLGLLISFAHSGGEGVSTWLSHLLEPFHCAKIL